MATGSIIRGYSNLILDKNKETAEARLKICQSNECGFYFSKFATCAHCGCMLLAKTRDPQAKCPIHKW